jgi:hypothetical protein
MRLKRSGALIHFKGRKRGADVRTIGLVKGRNGKIQAFVDALCGPWPFIPTLAARPIALWPSNASA